MDPLTTAAASGIRARMETLDLLANNLANAATTGYKLDRESYNLYFAPEALDGLSPGDSLSTVPVVERQWTDHSQGTLLPTGSPSDLAIYGKGFFAVNGPSGPLYTRNGNFRISAAGALTTAEGYPVRTADGQPFQLDVSKPFDVTRDGVISQDGRTVATLEIADFPQPDALTKQGKNYFVGVDGVAPQPARDAEIHQSKLEGSNVSPAEAAVHLVNVMRQFETLQRAIMLGAEMNRQAVDEVARVGT